MKKTQLLKSVSLCITELWSLSSCHLGREGFCLRGEWRSRGLDIPDSLSSQLSCEVIDTVPHLKSDGQKAHPRLKSGKLQLVTNLFIPQASQRAGQDVGRNLPFATACIIRQPIPIPDENPLRDKARDVGAPLGSQRQDPMTDMPGKHLPISQMEELSLKVRSGVQQAQSHKRTASFPLGKLHKPSNSVSLRLAGKTCKV